MIARIDDELHSRLKARAAAEGRSLNDLVTAALAAAVDQPTSRRTIRARASAAGLLVTPSQPKRIPTREEALAATRGLGQVASTALAAERADA
jgi:plasmid stability protein